MSAPKNDGIWMGIKSIFLWIGGIGLTLLLGGPVTLLAIFGAANAIHSIAVFWGRTVCAMLGMKVEVENPEKIHRDGPVIVVSNHQSISDVFVMYAGLPIGFRWMAKHTLFKIPIVGWGMAGAGYIAVNRDDRRKAMESMFAAAEQIKKGKSVIVFPEGTRGRPDGTMLPFKKGGFVLAMKAGVVIQPITIWGASKLMPKQKNRWIQRFYPGPVKMIVHDPIPPEEYKDLKIEELSGKIRAIIGGPMDRLREEFGDPPAPNQDKDASPAAKPAGKA